MVGLWLALGLLASCGGPSRQEPTLLLISLDGFRWDYRELAATPNMDRLAAEGVTARALIPVFPTKTFPNHYSIITGLYPDNHGVIANHMFDPILGDTFSLDDREAVADGRWYGGEPLWVTAQLQGRKSAAIFWPGSEAEIKGVRPTYWLPYDHDMSHEERVSQILAQLDLPAESRPAFLTMYFPDVDDGGHSGSDSVLFAAITRVDSTLGELLQGLETRGIREETNIIIVSDHGMTAVDSSRIIVLDDYVDLSQAGVVDWTPVLALRPPEDVREEIYTALKNAHPHMLVYRRDELPPRLRYSSHYRIPPIVALADEGWTISSRAYLERRPPRPRGGNHGFDNRHASMRGIFIGSGPAFNRGLEVGAFQNVHLYALMCAILKLEPAPHDGSIDSVKALLD
ncbi:MAG: ectonucleotide pyrophosphatase/phosphodiesterase [Candidatus Neomarinimicrobiota bacterium]